MPKPINLFDPAFREDPYPFYASAAKGPTISDADGRRYLDLWMGHYALILGHGFDGVKQAVADALDRGWHWGVPGEGQVRLAEKIREAVPVMEQMRFFLVGILILLIQHMHLEQENLNLMV